MARIFPTDITRLELAGAHLPELDTLRMLRDDLPGEYDVYHGVHWSREYAKKTVFGEVDFVIVNRNGEVMLIEQKNGPLVEQGGDLTKVYADSEKSAIGQISRSVDNVKAKFRQQHGPGRPLHTDYLVFCPDYRVRDVNAVSIDVRRIVDASAADGLAKRIEAVLGPGVGDKPWANLVRGFFRQSLNLVVDIHAYIAKQDRSLIRRTGNLARFLSHFEMSPLRLRVSGRAGCGKSLLAREAFDKAIQNGRRPLLVCFNRNLAERLKPLVAEGGYVNTWYGFCTDFLESRQQTVDFSKRDRNPRFWDDIQDRVSAEPIDDDWRFDTLIVDEGQDFEQEWYEILGLFVNDDADVLWLEDPDQNVRNLAPVDLDGFVTYRADDNYRSPERIARFIGRTLPFEFTVGNDVPGFDVTVHAYDDPDEQPRIVSRLCTRLTLCGFDANDIVVLSCRGIDSSTFSKLDKVGHLTLRRFTGDYDMFGNQMLTSGRLTFDTVRRFKGQQAPAVILVDADPGKNPLDQYQRLLYCGMTRATVRLEIVASRHTFNDPLFEQ